MLTQFLAEAVSLVISTAVGLLEGIVPSAFFDWVDVFASQLGTLLSYGPGSALGVLVVGYYAIDTAINAYVFAITTYKLVPVKST